MDVRLNSAKQLLAWLAGGLAAAVLLAWAFPRAYPLFPAEWKVSQVEAKTIAMERFRDLGDLPEDPYVVARVTEDSTLEYRLQELLESRSPAEVAATRLARSLMTWEVTLYERAARSSEWSYRARIAPNGELTALQLRIPPETEGEDIEAERAITLAERFLRDQEIPLEEYEAPQIRTRDHQARKDTYLRFRDLESALGEGHDYGLEVTFAGDILAGYSAYNEDPDRAAIQAPYRILTLLNQVWVFLPLILLPLVAIPFVRRYHAGEIGVRRGIEISGLVLLAGVIVMVFCARAAGAGWSTGVLTRPQVIWTVVFQMLVLFFFPMGLMAFLSWSVGESLCREGWGGKLAAFDALFKRAWKNATFAGASLRGIVGGIVVLATLMSLIVVLRELGVWASTSFYLGPWWHSAGWFSVPLVAFGLAYMLYQGLFGQLLLVPFASRWLGRWGGPLAATILGAFLFLPPLFVFPMKWSIGFWILSAGAYVFLFLRYGIFTALLAHLTAFVLAGALPFLTAGDPGIQLHASLALLAVAAPLIVSARSLLSSEVFAYRYEDIPPHVRRIADRERQKVELETARRIQTSILPKLPPQLNGVRLASSYLPATEVGGDFYDVLALEDGRLAVAVGDVAGHGVSSGLVMSMAKSALAVQVSFNPEVEDVFRTLNRMVHQSARKRLLTTLCYAVIDPVQREMFYASAGHLFPYRIATDGRVDALESVSYPLGVRDEIEVRVRAANLSSGDLLFLFSDGVVEARAENSEDLFGFERLEESLKRHAGADVESFKSAVLSDLSDFTGDVPRQDDLTVLVLGIP